MSPGSEENDGAGVAGAGVAGAGVAGAGVAGADKTWTVYQWKPSITCNHSSIDIRHSPICVLYYPIGLSY